MTCEEFRNARLKSLRVSSFHPLCNRISFSYFSPYFPFPIPSHLSDTMEEDVISNPLYRSLVSENQQLLSNALTSGNQIVFCVPPKRYLPKTITKETVARHLMRRNYLEKNHYMSVENSNYSIMCVPSKRGETRIHDQTGYKRFEGKVLSEETAFWEIESSRTKKAYRYTIWHVSCPLGYQGGRA